MGVADRASDSPSPVARWEWLALAVAVVVGGVLRLWGIADLPPGLWYDEAIIGQGVLRILRDPGFPIFFMIQGHPEEPLFYYLNVPAVALFGASATALRATSAVIGTLTIPAVWWAVRRLFGPRQAAVAVLVFAAMRWHVHFSRLSFRTLLSPAFCAIATGFLAEAVRGNRRRDWVLAGAALGAGLYTYLSMRLFVVACGVSGAFALLQARRDGRAAAMLRNAAFGIGAVLLVFLPLGIDYVRHPEHFGARQREVVDQMTAGRVARQAVDVALMPMLRGDHVAKHNIPGPPRFAQAYLWSTDGADSAAQWEDAGRGGGPLADVPGRGVAAFDVVSGALFYAGLVLTLVAAARGSWSDRHVLAWLFVGSLASILSFGAPNMLRLLLLTPVAAMLIARGVLAVGDALAARAGRAAGVALVAVFVAFFAAGEARRYFVDWPAHPRTWWEFNSGFAEAARWMRHHADELPAAVVMPVEIADAPTFAFEADGVRDRIRRDVDGAPDATEDAWYFVTLPPWPANRVAPRDGKVLADFQLPGGEPWARIVDPASEIGASE